MFNQSTLPPNSTKIEYAFEQSFVDALPDVSVVSTLMNPETIPVELIGYLAWSFSVDEWDPDWDEEEQRETTRQSVGIQRRKGTLTAVKAALKAAGYGDATIVEGKPAQTYDGTRICDGSWAFEAADHWAEYRVYLVRPISIKQAAQVRRILQAVAPVHCHLKGLFFKQAANLYDGSFICDGTYTFGVVE